MGLMTEPERRQMTSKRLVEAAQSRIENLDPAELAIELETDVVLVDLREEDEIRAHGRIADSVWAPRGMLEFWADPASPDHREEFNRDRRLILYCATGNRSALAAETLDRLGFRHVAHLRGGLRAWKESGRPVEPS